MDLNVRHGPYMVRIAHRERLSRAIYGTCSSQRVNQKFQFQNSVQSFIKQWIWSKKFLFFSFFNSNNKPYQDLPHLLQATHFLPLTWALTLTLRRQSITRSKATCKGEFKLSFGLCMDPLTHIQAKNSICYKWSLHLVDHLHSYTQEEEMYSERRK